MVKLASLPVGLTNVRLLTQSIVDAQKQTYTDLGNNSTTDFAMSTPSGSDVRAIARDKQSNVYVVDGNVGVVKYNSEGTKLWRVSLPASDIDHIIRALEVDTETGTVYAGVSAGGDSTTAAMWAYRQLDDNGTEMLWQIEPGGFIERVRLKDGVLYALLNFPDRNRSYVRTYGFVDTEAPGQQAEWEVPSPGNDLDVSPKDDSVFVASDVNPLRGLDPSSPLTTVSSIDFTPKDLNQSKKRIWSWFDTSDRSTLSILPRTDGSGDDGGEVIVLGDKSGNGRNFYANAGASPAPPTPNTERGPVYRAVGLNGKPTISFTGESYTATTPGRSMLGEGASSADRAYRAEQLSPVPTYKGAQFAIFMVVKCGIDDAVRGLLSLNVPGANTQSRMLAINRRPDDTLPGSIPMPGSVHLYELFGRASDGGQSTPSAIGPDITANPARVSPGPLSGSGVAIITWICDGGVHDQAGSASRSLMRINGHPVDRWQSIPFFTTLPVTLGLANLGTSGHSRFAGEFAEMIVLSDWYDQNGFQQRLVTEPSFPDSVWTPDSDTEVDRIEGYLAHKWGVAHEFPTGQAGWFSMTTNPSNGDTQTIDGVQYTFRSGALSAANEVHISTVSFRLTATNLYYAINKIGQPGVDYDQRTVKHPTFQAMAPFESASNTVWMAIKSISPYANPITLTSSGAITWTAGTTATTINGAGTSHGWYPHSFTLQKTNNSRGGPPSANGNTQGQVSEFLLLQSKFGSLTKWSATSGRLIWALTTGRGQFWQATPPTLVLPGFGGVGYACRVNSDGDIYSVGPRVPASAGRPAVSPADIVDIRKVADGGAVPTSPTGDPWILNTVPDPFDSTGFGYQRPRLDTDGFDNLYVPISFGGTGVYSNVSAVGYRKASSAGFAREFVRISSLPFTNDCYSIQADPNHPDFSPDDTIQHGEFFYLGAKVDPGDTGKQALFKFRTVDVILESGTQRQSDILAVCDGNISIVTSSSVTPVVGGQLDPSADYIDAVQMYGNVFFTDGKSYLYYDGKTRLLKPFKSTTSGLIQPRCKLMTQWNGRLVLARSADNAHFWSMSQHGNPFGWDLFPLTDTETDAVAGSSSQAGQAPDIITSLIAYSNDILIIGGDHSIYKMSGDPKAGGRFDQISSTIGMAFGRAWAQDPDGMLYFADNRGEIYRLSPSGAPRGLSRNRISNRIRQVDFEHYRLELVWNTDDDGLHVFQIPYGNGGVYQTHWFWERGTDAWHEDTFGSVFNTGVQPTAAMLYDADDPDDRKLLVGGEDGFVRQWSSQATSDDGMPIDSFVTIGPLMPKGSNSEWMFTDIDTVMATEQSGPNWYLYGSKTADDKGSPLSHGKLVPGRNPTILARVRGAVSFIRLGLADGNARWSYEDIQMQAVPMGRKGAIS
jgi:hypothetical protein